MTKVNVAYELRSGKVVLQSNVGEESWFQRTVSGRAISGWSDSYNPPCLMRKTTTINEENLLATYPAAKQSRKCGPDGVFQYKNRYNHLNALFKFGIKDTLK